MIRNIELLETTLQFINDHEDKHDQNVWFRLDDNRGKAVTKTCETAACFAGWACLLSGYKHYGSYIYTWRGVRLGDVYQIATRLLGLEEWEAFRLFNSDNTRPMLARMVKDLVNGDELRDREDYLDDN
jgi:hypothetical protein